MRRRGSITQRCDTQVTAGLRRTRSLWSGADLKAYFFTQAFVASSHFMSFIFSHSAELCGVSPRLSPDGVVATEDADHPLILVDHRQPADLQFLHMLRRLGEVIVLTAAMNA